MELRSAGGAGGSADGRASPGLDVARGRVRVRVRALVGRPPWPKAPWRGAPPSAATATAYRAPRSRRPPERAETRRSPAAGRRSGASPLSPMIPLLVLGRPSDSDAPFSPPGRLARQAAALRYRTRRRRNDSRVQGGGRVGVDIRRGRSLGFAVDSDRSTHGRWTGGRWRYAGSARS